MAARTWSDSLVNPVDLYAGRLMPDEQVEAFRHTERLFPSRRIARGGAVRSWPGSGARLADVSIVTDNGIFDLFDYVSRNRVAGLLIARDGTIVHEQYELGNAPATRWLSMSMAKSVATTLVGVAIADGHIGSVDDLLTDYLPELRTGGYARVSIRHLLQMTSGVDWDDTHTDASSDRRHMLDLQMAQQVGAIVKFVASRRSVAAPGARWNYSTGETHLVGALVRAATGEWLSDYLSRRIWSPLGMERAAHWWLEAPQGLEVAGSGISATLRDYARFGQFMLDRGEIDGETVLPPGWLNDATAVRTTTDGAPLPYGFMWWAVPDRAGSYVDGAFSARGIFGQYLYLNPRQRVLVAVNSARSKPKFAEAILDNDFFNAVAAALR